MSLNPTFYGLFKDFQRQTGFPKEMDLALERPDVFGFLCLCQSLVFGKTAKDLPKDSAVLLISTSAS